MCFYWPPTEWVIIIAPRRKFMDFPNETLYTIVYLTNTYDDLQSSSPVGFYDY